MTYSIVACAAIVPMHRKHCSSVSVYEPLPSNGRLLYSCLFRGRCLATGLHAAIYFLLNFTLILLSSVWIQLGFFEVNSDIKVEILTKIQVLLSLSRVFTTLFFSCCTLGTSGCEKVEWVPQQIRFNACLNTYELIINNILFVFSGTFKDYVQQMWTIYSKLTVL
jgi:hypothetical protein